jgi:hypothetical protein
MSFRQKLLWLSLVGLTMQFGLGLVWFSVLMVFVSQVTSADPALKQIYLKVQQQAATSLSPSQSETERFLDNMLPIFQQVPWPTVAVVSSLLGFVVLGFLYGRISGSVDFLGALPVLALLSGQNPITMAMMVADRGIEGAHFGWLGQIAMLVLQLITIYIGGWLGARLWKPRPAP